MDKIFNIVAEFELTKKPLWLDAFRQKYDKPYQYHISLTTLAYCEKSNLENLKNDLKNIANLYSEIKVIFKKPRINTTTKGGCIMIMAEPNVELFRLQKDISTKFSKLGKHISHEYETFEINFNPHITIARHLTTNQLEDAKDDLKNDFYCEALIDTLVLTIATEDSFEELDNPKNKSFFKLQ